LTWIKVDTMGRMLNILVVEDSQPDVVLLRRALDAGGRGHQVSVAGDGVEALEVLQAGDFPRGRPDLILLDLNMPRMDGRELLERVKGDPALASIPVVVLSTSSSVDDVQGAYRRSCNAYVTKPQGLADFDVVVRKLEAFWADCVASWE